jgi:adenylate cyclase class IV
LTTKRPKSDTPFLEIEHKWNADDVDWDGFVSFFAKLKPDHKTSEISVTGPDAYYRLGAGAPRIAERIAGLTMSRKNSGFNRLKWRIRKVLRSAGLGASIIRLRHSPNLYQMTVKRRTQANSTQVREEADIDFLRRVPVAEVEAFLTLAGYSKDFTLMKKCHIFWVKTPLGVAVVVVYDITRTDKPKDRPRRFVEVEAEKGQTLEASKRILEHWSKVLGRRFGLTDDKRNHLSLYEVYSGRRYIGA